MLDLMRRKLVVSLKPEENGSMNNYISYHRMTEWEVNPESVSSFMLYLTFNGNKDKKVPLVKFSNNFSLKYFVGATNKNYITLDANDIPNEHIESISMNIRCFNTDWTESDKEIFTEKMDDYIQLYPTDKPYEWSNAKHNGKLSAVCVPVNKALFDSPSVPVKSFSKDIDDCKYFWREFESSVQFKDANDGVVRLNCVDYHTDVM